MSDVREVSEYHEAAVDYTCAECGYDWPNITSADECAVIDAAEARLTRNAGKRRITRDVVKSDD